MGDALGGSTDYNDGYKGTRRAYELIVETLCREYGVFELDSEDRYRGRNYYRELVKFFLEEESVDKVLDVIELSFRVVDAMTRNFEFLHTAKANERADHAIKELNSRFQEHAIGFQFAEGEILRIDSSLIHSEVVKPVLVLLQSKDYAGAQAEFLRAHEHYRKGNAKEVLNECLKALESAMKVICEKQKWAYPANPTCSALIQVCLDNKLVPIFWTQHFSALRSTLESGVPTARNKLGGHGQGGEVITVPQHLVSYVLHMTASCLVFLIESEKSLS